MEVVYVSVSGLIGACKSTVLGHIENSREELVRDGFDGGVTVIPENLSEWAPLLAKFYEDPKQYAGYVQIVVAQHFAGIHRQLRELRESSAAGEGRRRMLLVSERCHLESSVFVDEALDTGNMNREIQAVYARTCTNLDMDTLRPDHIIYMRVSPDTCLRRCRERARGCEVGLTDTYMRSLWGRYAPFLACARESGVPVHTVDAEQSRACVGQQVMQILRSF